MEAVGVEMKTRDGHRNDKLEGIPGIGPSLANDLRGLGVHRTSDLQGQDAESLYTRLCDSTGTQVDRCVLYAFRCAVYFASHSEHQPNLLKWWNWTDERMPAT